MASSVDLLSGQTVSVCSRYTRKVYAQKEPASMTKGWRDRAMEGDDHWGVISENEIVTYVCTHEVEELEYDGAKPNHHPDHFTSGGLKLNRNVYHLIMWRGRFVWIDDRKGYLLPT